MALGTIFPPVNGLTTSLLSTHTRALIPQIPCVSAWGFVAHLQGTLPSSFSLFLTVFLLLFSSAFILLLFLQFLRGMFETFLFSFSSFLIYEFLRLQISLLVLF